MNNCDDDDDDDGRVQWLLRAFSIGVQRQRPFIVSLRLRDCVHYCLWFLARRSFGLLRALSVIVCAQLVRPRLRTVL